MSKEELYLKNKRLISVVLTGTFLAMLYWLHSFIFLNNGDDFMFGVFGKTGPFQNALDYYFTGNGRLWVNTVNGVILRYDRWVYFIFNPIVIVLHVFLLAKNAQFIIKDSSVSIEDVYISSMAVFCCHGIMCLQETVFWICGSVNYLFTATLFLTGLYFLQLSDVAPLSKGQKLIYSICSILIASSMEQFALMYVGIHIISFLVSLKRNTEKKLKLFITFLSAAALLVLLLAPGNYARVSDANALQDITKIINNAWTILNQNSFSDASFPFMLMLSLAIAFSAEGCFLEKPILVRVYKIIPVVLVCAKVIPSLQKAIIYLPLILIYVFIVVAFWLYEKIISNKVLLLTLCVCILGAQAIPMVADIWGYRYMFCTYIILSLFILYLLYKVDSIDRLLVILMGITAAYAVKMCLPLILVLLLIRHWKERKVQLRGILCFAITCLCVLHGMEILSGYRANSAVIKRNIVATRQYTEGTLLLEKLPTEHYSWCYLPVTSEWFQKYYKEYYNLSPTVEIVCIENRH